MKPRLHLLAFAAVLALQPCLAAAQSSPARKASRARTLGNPHATSRGPAWGFSIGMTSGSVNEYGYPYVVAVVKGSSAEQAGLAVGDTILSVDGRDARQPPLFPRTEPGTRYVLRVLRGREEQEITYRFPQPAETPRPEPGRAPGQRRR